MQGKICLVTGANAGIGKATCIGLAQKQATVIMACRNKDKGEAARREIIACSNNENVHLHLVDLASLASIRRFAAEFQQQYQRLDVLINNAAAFFSSYGETADGIERQFAISHLASFLLTQLLLEMIRDSKPSRIVNVSSTVHKIGKIDFDDLGNKRKYNGVMAYAQSKLCNVLFTYELARRLKDIATTVNCLHPGGVRTQIGATNSGPLLRLGWNLLKPFMISPAKGARTSIYLASSPEVADVTGKYFDRCRAQKSSPLSYDEGIARRLWQVSEELVRE